MRRESGGYGGDSGDIGDESRAVGRGWCVSQAGRSMGGYLKRLSRGRLKQRLSKR